MLGSAVRDLVTWLFGSGGGWNASRGGYNVLRIDR